MYLMNIFEIILILFLPINNVYILPFDTITLNNPLQSSQNSEFYNQLFQTELYVNLTIGTPPQNVKSLIKFDSPGFYINEGAFNYTLSSTSKKYYWPISKYFFNSVSYMVGDIFYINFYKSYNDFITNKNNAQELNIIKTNETLFIVINKDRKNINKNIFYNYGYVGLDYKEKNNNEPPETTHTFIDRAHKYWNIKKNIFYLEFNKDNQTYKNYFNNYYRGYFILGENLVTDEDEKNKIKFIYLSKDKISYNWIIYFDNIYLKTNEQNIHKFNFTDATDNLEYGAELKVNLPYIVGSYEYLNYINNSFFNELINKKICFFNLLNNTIAGKYYYSFICNSQSEFLMNKLENNFPDLIFESKNLLKNFTLSKNDLFAYNNMDTSDNNLYFLIIFHKEIKNVNKNWIIGIPFFRKYIFSFDYENKQIGYYDKKEVNMNQKNNKEYSSLVSKIFFIIILIVIIFILGIK